MFEVIYLQSKFPFFVLHIKKFQIRIFCQWEIKFFLVSSYETDECVLIQLYHVREKLILDSLFNLVIQLQELFAVGVSIVNVRRLFISSITKFANKLMKIHSIITLKPK